MRDDCGCHKKGKKKKREPRKLCKRYVVTQHRTGHSVSQVTTIPC